MGVAQHNPMIGWLQAPVASKWASRAIAVACCSAAGRGLRGAAHRGASGDGLPQGGLQPGALTSQSIRETAGNLFGFVARPRA